MKKTAFILSQFLLTFLPGISQTVEWSQVAHPNGLQVNGVAFSSDGQKIISGTNCHPSKIRLYATTDGTITWDYTVSNSFMCIMGVGFSSNGNYFAGVEEMGNILVFNNTGSQPALTNTIAMGTSYAFSIDFSPNAAKLAVGGSNGKLQTYHVGAGTQELNINAHTSWVTSVNYSPDNTKIASGGSDAKIKLWDTTGVLLNTLSSHTGQITCLKFTKDNTHLISTSLDNTIKIWNAVSGILLQTITPSAYAVMGVDVSNDSKRIVTVSSDKFIRIYNLETLALEASFGLMTNDPLCVSWSQINPHKIVAGYSDGTLTLYDIEELLTVSVKEHNVSNDKISVFPSVFPEKTNACFPQNTVSKIEVRSINGTLIKSISGLETNTCFNFNASDFNEAGTYLISFFMTDHRVNVKRVVKINP